MEAVSRGAAESGGHVIGITAPALFPHRSGANRFVHQVVEASSLGRRIDTMMELASAAIALPGSIGTAAELVIAWNLNYIAREGAVRAIPTAAVGKAWRELGRALIEMAGATPHHIHWAEDSDEALDWVLRRLG